MEPNEGIDSNRLGVLWVLWREEGYFSDFEAIFGDDVTR